MNPEMVEVMNVIAPFLSGAFGVGMTYGILKTKIDALKEQVDNNVKKLDMQVGDLRCAQMRSECQKHICNDLKDIKSEIIRLREKVQK